MNGINEDSYIEYDIYIDQPKNIGDTIRKHSNINEY